MASEIADIVVLNSPRLKPWAIKESLIGFSQNDNDLQQKIAKYICK